MNVTEPDSGLYSNGLTTLVNKPEPKASSNFKNRTIKIVVAARQCPSGSYLDRGYGDIASGVRALGYIKKLFPEATCSFVFEHHAADIDELNRLRSIATIDDVKTFILDGFHEERFRLSEQQLAEVHQKEDVCQLLHEANFIFHGPSGLIAPLASSNGEFASKTVGVSEYEIKTGCYQQKEHLGIEEIGMGFRYKRLYLMDQTYPDAEFKNDLLRKYCTNPLSKSSGTNYQDVFYFAYGHSLYFLARMLRIVVLMEGNNSRDVVLVSPTKLDLDDASEYFSDLLPSCCPYKSVKVFIINSDNQRAETLIFQNPAGQQEKNIHIIFPDRLENSDFHLLQQGSVINYTSGDISTSDVLANGKIPIVDPSKKNYLFMGMSAVMKEFCEIVGNEQYCSLIKPWETAGLSFANHGRKKFSVIDPDEIPSLQQLGGSQWQAFERDFTDWLKQNNQTESFILEKAKAIIHKPESARSQLINQLEKPTPQGFICYLLAKFLLIVESQNRRVLF